MIRKIFQAVVILWGGLSNVCDAIDVRDPARDGHALDAES